MWRGVVALGLLLLGCPSTVGGTRGDAGGPDLRPPEVPDVVLRDGCESRPFRPVDPNLRPEPVVDPRACAEAPSLSGPGPHTLALAGQPLLQRGCVGARALIAPVALRRLLVPAGRALTVGGDGVRIGLHPAPCDLNTCLGEERADVASPGLSRRTWVNDTGSDAVVLLTVSSPNPVTRPLASALVTARLTAEDVGRGCAEAPELPIGSVAYDQAVPAMTEIAPECARSPAALARWYRARVEAGETLSVSVIVGARQGTSGTVRLYPDCGPTCLAAGQVSVTEGVATAAWTNPSASARELRVAVTGTGHWALVATRVARAPHGTCAAARPLAPERPAQGESMLQAGEAPPVCVGVAGAPAMGALFYAVDVPPGTVMFARAQAAVSYLTTSSTYPIRLQVYEGCDGGCAATVEAPPASSEVSWVNRGATARRVIVALGYVREPPPAPYDLSVRLDPFSARLDCAAAGSLNACVAFLDQELPGVSDRVPTCAGAVATRAARYYTARVLPGERLRIRSYPTLGQPPAVEAFEGCATGQCIGRWGIVSDGAALGYLWFMNRTPAPRDLVVVVSGERARFDLDVDFAPAPFAVARVPAACDDMAGAAVVDINVAQPGSLQLPLPFDFRYVGQNLRVWSVSRFGYLQVWRAEGSSLLRHLLAELPESAAPANAIAPFWDDGLTFGEASAVQWRVLGAPGRRRLTVAWQRLAHPASDAPLTFQAKLFEGTGAIEYHYCEAGSSPEARGAQAEVGLQDDTGDLGVTWSFRRADAVATGTALRFTPTR